MTVSEIAHGHVHRPTLSADVQRTASFYADPVAWLVVDAVEAALATAGDAVRYGGTEVGVVSISDEGTLHTMRLMASGLRRHRVAPLRFAGANPGAVAGLPCIVFGFKGPSLMLSMPVDAGRPVAEMVARGWLGSGACSYVVINEHEVGADGAHAVRSRVIGR